jgi:hypothetical protein
MSRTDAHVPLYVRLARGDLVSHEVHDHRRGDRCDLPDRPTSWRAPRTTCYWEFVYTGTSVCSCWMCHGGAEHRRDRRRERHATRALLRVWSVPPDAPTD